jgi:hypothetical protein
MTIRELKKTNTKSPAIACHVFLVLFRQVRIEYKDRDGKRWKEMERDAEDTEDAEDKDIVVSEL